ncbi:VanW family protein [Kineosporia sp. NBRC 101731]|uniref:VanW family protein n=1 Tax=Kineosporia sp. NBRC 101731 TaxID=3032199 RepID=UPI0024A4F4CF|nr:VanW family protein [Kineosporia sp. NBRC 101731]GLY28550.1 vanomycin resistance protein VanB [Kineosporia sp. NBRC 101731]
MAETPRPADETLPLAAADLQVVADESGLEPGFESGAESELESWPEPVSGGEAGTGGRRWAVVGAVLAGGALTAYLGAAWLNSDRVAGGTTVAGVAIGGRDRADAVGELRRAYADLGGEVTLTAAGHTQPVSPDDLGLTLDAAAVVDRLTGFTLNPATLWRRVAGGGAHDADPELADPTVEQGLKVFAGNVAQAPVNASIIFDGTTPEVREAVPGHEIASSAVRRVRAHWLTGEVTVPVATRAPRVSTADARRALVDQAGPAVSGPLVVRVGGTGVELEPAQFVPSLAFAVKNGKPALTVDGKKLRKVVLAEGKGISKEPVDAGFRVRGGRPEVVPGRNGVTVAAAPLARTVLGALRFTAEDQRVARVPVSVREPELTTAKARKLGVKERISTFSTNLTADAGRTENLRIAARTVNGTVVMPGETFSLNQVLGERTPEKGYHPAPAISGGRLVRDYGGGVSQMATTIFNNVFFAGLEDVYHKPHSFYIARYPEGREATVNWPTVDLRWKNDTPTAVLVEASVGSQVNVSFYGTRYWDVTAGRSERSNHRTPQTVYDDSAGCVSQGASAGFDVSVSRTFRRPGSAQVERTQTFQAVYNAEDRVICGPEPKPSEPPDDEETDRDTRPDDRGGRDDSAD